MDQKKYQKSHISRWQMNDNVFLHMCFCVEKVLHLKRVWNPVGFKKPSKTTGWSVKMQLSKSRTSCYKKIWFCEFSKDYIPGELTRRVFFGNTFPWGMYFEGMQNFWRHKKNAAILQLTGASKLAIVAYWVQTSAVGYSRKWRNVWVAGA